MFKKNHMRGRNNTKVIKINRVKNMQKLMKMMIPIQKEMMMVDSVSQERFLVKFL